MLCAREISCQGLLSTSLFMYRKCVCEREKEIVYRIKYLPSLHPPMPWTPRDTSHNDKHMIQRSYKSCSMIRLLKLVELVSELLPALPWSSDVRLFLKMVWARRKWGFLSMTEKSCHEPTRGTQANLISSSSLVLNIHRQHVIIPSISTSKQYRFGGDEREG